MNLSRDQLKIPVPVAMRLPTRADGVGNALRQMYAPECSSEFDQLLRELDRVAVSPPRG